MKALAVLGFLVMPVFCQLPKPGGGGGSGDAVSIHGRAIQNCSPGDGQMLVWNASTSQYECSTPAGGGDVSGGSISATGELAAYANTGGKAIGRSFVAFSGPSTTLKTYSLPDANAHLAIAPFPAVRDSASQVTLGPDCSSTVPCNYAVGDTVTSVVTPGTASSPSGSGTVRFGISSTGTLTAWHNLAGLTCGGSLSGACVGSTTSFPSGSTPLASCTVSGGSFDSGGCSDLRTYIRRDLYLAGTGLSLSGSTFSIGPTVSTFSSGTSSPPATCVVGEKYLRTDTDQAYECTSTNVYTETTGGSSGGGITSLGGQTGATQTFANDTNVTMSSASNTHTLGWTGQLAVSRGGTGLSSGTSGGVPYFSSTSAMTSSGVLGANQFVFGGGAGSAPFTNSNIAATPANSLVTITGNTSNPRLYLVGAGSGWSPTLDLDHLATSGAAIIGFRYANTARMSIRYTQTASASTSRLSTYWNADANQGGWTVSNSNGGVGIGQITPLPVSTLGISDRTATTGVTRVIVEAGAGQSSTNLLEFQERNATHGSGAVYTAIGPTGLLTTYNAETTAAVGQPYIRSSASLTSQTAAISSGNLLTNAAAGLYRATAYMHTTSPPGDTCTATLILGYTYNSGAKSVTMINGHDLNTDENGNSATYTFRADASSNITREVTVAGACGTYTYDLFLTLERLQ